MCRPVRPVPVSFDCMTVATQSGGDLTLWFGTGASCRAGRRPANTARGDVNTLRGRRFAGWARAWEWPRRGWTCELSRTLSRSTGWPGRGTAQTAGGAGVPSGAVSVCQGARMSGGLRAGVYGSGLRTWWPGVHVVGRGLPDPGCDGGFLWGRSVGCLVSCPEPGDACEFFDLDCDLFELCGGQGRCVFGDHE